MSSQEIPITISPQQAAHGVILTVPVGTGTARLRIPSSVRDGDLVRARLGDDEVLLRVTVAGAPGPAQPAPAPRAEGSARPAPAPTVAWAAQPAAPAPAPGARKGVGGRLAALGVLAVVVVGIIALNSGDDSGTTASDVPTATPSTTYSGGAGPGSDPSSSAPAPEPTASPEDTPTPEDTETEAVASPPAPEPSPFDKGTCLNGTLPDSTTPQSVTGVDEVPCSASDAHYRVIESFPFTSDLDRCNDNPKTEYAFSYRYTRGATVINEYVYCLVGIGSYGR